MSRAGVRAPLAYGHVRRLSAAVASCLLSLTSAPSQTPTTILSRVEPGLDEAVKWKWKVESADLPTADRPAPVSAETHGSPAPVPQSGEEGTYTVKKGDVLYRVARRYRITVEQLKAANDLKADLIHPGDVLRIPSPEELAALATPAPQSAARAAPTTAQGPITAEFDPEVLLLQVYLDRLGFSPGPIDGVSGLRFQNLMFSYLSVQGGDAASLAEKARAELPQPFSTYILRPEDFRWIQIPRRRERSQQKLSPEQRSREIYRELTSRPELLYTSAWEFVAERFHCEVDRKSTRLNSSH